MRADIPSMFLHWDTKWRYIYKEDRTATLKNIFDCGMFAPDSGDGFPGLRICHCGGRGLAWCFFFYDSLSLYLKNITYHNLRGFDLLPKYFTSFTSGRNITEYARQISGSLSAIKRSCDINANQLKNESLCLYNSWSFYDFTITTLYLFCFSHVEHDKSLFFLSLWWQFCVFLRNYICLRSIRLYQKASCKHCDWRNNLFDFILVGRPS